MNLVKNCNSKPINRTVYILFLGVGLVSLLLKDYNNALIFLGLAPVFDPFDPKIRFADRRKWQNALLLLNLSLTITALVLLLIK